MGRTQIVRQKGSRETGRVDGEGPTNFLCAGSGFDGDLEDLPPRAHALDANEDKFCDPP